MRFTPKQRIILLSAGGIAVVLLIGLILFASCTPKTKTPAVSPSPAATDSPTPRPTPTHTPSPVPTETPIYRLPLVPQTAEPTGEGFFAGESFLTPHPPQPTDPLPESELFVDDRAGSVKVRPVFAPISDSPVVEGRYDSGTRDFLTVGLLEGKPVALLFARLAPPRIDVLSLPCEVLPVPETEEHSAAEYGEQLLGLRLTRTLSIDLSCMPAMIEAVPTMSGGGMTFDADTFRQVMQATGSRRAYGMGALGVGVVRLFSGISPWDIPALHRATKNKIHSNLNLLELFTLAACMRGVTTTAIYVVPTVESDGEWTVDSVKARQLVQSVFN